MTAPRTTTAGHPEYTASALAWRASDGTVTSRRALIVQCPTVDHEHTTQTEVNAKLEVDPEVGQAWVVTAHGPNGMNAMEAAHTAATALASLLPLGGS